MSRTRTSDATQIPSNKLNKIPGDMNKLQITERGTQKQSTYIETVGKEKPTELQINVKTNAQMSSSTKQDSTKLPQHENTTCIKKELT